MPDSPTPRHRIGIILVITGLLGLLLSSLFAQRLAAPETVSEDGDVRATIIARATLTAATEPTPPATRPGPTVTPAPAATTAPSPTAAVPLAATTTALATTPAATQPAATELPPPTPTPTAAVPLTEVRGVVSAVLSGDTIEAFVNGQYVTVRYLAIDAPALDEPCGPQARDANAALVLPLEVRLVPDQTDRDAEGRLLRYVYVGTTLVNAALVADGWAVADPVPPDTALAAEIAAAGAAAAGRGCAALP